MTDRTAVRRSPLAERHVALGALWVDPAAHWPASYGDAALEDRALRGSAGLVDWGALDKLSLSGAGLALPPPAPRLVPGRVATGTAAGHPAELWGMAPDEALLLLPASEGTPTVGRLLGADGPATDVSSAFAALHLAGPHAGRVLEELAPIDLGEAALPEGSVAFGPVANVAVTIARRDRGGLPGYTILVERDLAEYLWDALLGVGARHGLVPVGASALEWLLA